MKPVTIFTSTSGLNNLVDPKRLRSENGQIELAEAVNVLIDRSGMPYRRPGRSLVSSGSFHSLYCDGGVSCFCIQERTDDAAIMQLDSSNNLVGIRSGLTKALRMGWCQVGEDTYYSNGAQNGKITDGISAAWSAQEHVGAETTRQFSGPPLGNQLFHFAGRIWIVEDNILWYSEPFAYGKYDLARNFFWFKTEIQMAVPVENGIFISDSKKTYFYEGTNPKEMKPDVVINVPAHKYSVAIDKINGSKIGLPEAGMCVVWSCNLGLCLGTENGVVNIVTSSKLNYPSGSQGATLIRDDIIINTID